MQGKLASDLWRMATMDSSTAYPNLCSVRDHYHSAANSELGEGRVHAQGSVDPDWRPLCAGSCPHFSLAHYTTYHPLYETHSAETHRTDTMDGPDLCIKCVAGSAVSPTFDLRGFPARMLRSLRDLQLHGLLIELLESRHGFGNELRA